jgi:hypothetical protein
VTQRGSARQFILSSYNERGAYLQLLRQYVRAYRSAKGRQCRSWVIDPRGMFCPRHCDAQPNGPDDHALHLLQRACSFKNAEGIRDSLSRLYSLLAADASPRRAAVLGYLSSLLLRTLPAMYNDPYPKRALPCPPPN